VPTATLTTHLNRMAEVLKIVAHHHRNGTLDQGADTMLSTDIGHDIWFDGEDGDDRCITVWRSTNAAGVTTLRGWLSDLDPQGEHMMVLAV